MNGAVTATFARFRTVLAIVTMAVCAEPAVAQAVDFLTPGAAPALATALRGSSLLLQAGVAGATPQDILAAARADYGRLVGALYAEGYYSGVIRITLDGREAASIPPLDAPSRIERIMVMVEPGTAFRFAAARVAPVAPGTALPPGFAPGQPARSGAVQDAVTAATLGWRRAGYAKVALADQRVSADHAAATLDAELILAPGPVVTFGVLGISGNRGVRTERIRDIAGLPTGQRYDVRQVEKAASRLRRTGAFSSVALTEAETLGPGDTLEIGAAVVEQPPRRFGFGAELASIDGLTLSGFWLHRNLLGGAESLRFDGIVSGIGSSGDSGSGGINYTLGASFTRPATFTPDTTLFIDGLLERADERDYVAERASLTAGLSRAVSDKLTVRAGAGVSYERATDDLGTSNFTTLSLPLSAVRDGRDVALNPTRGTFLELGLTPYAGFGDAGSGARLNFDGRAFRGLGADNGVILAARVQGGAVFGSGLFDTPRDYLFYSGGGGSVRGQPYQSLGVESPSPVRPGAVVRTGGVGYLGASGEVRGRVSPTIGLVGFVDAGFVTAKIFDEGDMHAGAGVGVRYNTGIGPIRLDVAAPVAGDTGDGVQFYVGIGQAF